MQIITHRTHSVRRLAMLVALNGISMSNLYSRCGYMVEIVPNENLIDALRAADMEERTRMQRWTDNHIFKTEGGRRMVYRDIPTAIIFYDQLFSPDCRSMNDYFKLRNILKNSSCRIFACDSRDSHIVWPPRFSSPEYALITEIAHNCLPYAGTDERHRFVNSFLDEVLRTYAATEFIKDPETVSWSSFPVHRDFGCPDWPAIQANRLCFEQLEDWLMRRMRECARVNTVSFTDSDFGKFTHVTVKMHSCIY